MKDWLIRNFLAERDRWFAFIPLLFGLGIGIYFALSFEPSMWITLVILELMLLVAYLWRYKSEKLIILGALSLVVLGFADAQLKSIFLSPPDNVMYSDNETYLKGLITDISHNYNGKLRLVLDNVTDLDDKPLNGTYRITVNKNYNKLEVGQCAEVVATSYPLMKPGLVGGYQFDRKAYFEGISALGYSTVDAYETKCTDNILNTPWNAKLYNIRQNIVERISKAMPATEAAVAAALIAGDRGLLNQQLQTRYQNSGLAHFLAISGLHMGMIAFLMFFFVRLIIAAIPALALKYNSKKIAAVGALIASFVYLLISGAGIPAQRAFLMTLVVLMGIIFDREAISLRTIAFAAMVVLIISPQALISAGFQMSFAAVLVMTAFYERFSVNINQFFAGGLIKRYIIGYLIGIIISDLVATIATLPFSIYHFHKIAIYTSIGNFLAGPIIALWVMPAILISLLCLPFGLENFPLKIVGKGIAYINDITSYVSSLPDAGYKTTVMPFWGLLLICFGGLWLCIWQKSWRKLGIVPVLIGFASMLTVKTPDFITNKDADVFALKDNFGHIIVMPSNGNKFIKDMWLEHYGQDKLDLQKKKELSDIYAGKINNTDWLDLRCDDFLCTYKGIIVFAKDGGVKINNNIVDTEGNLGFSAYIEDNSVKIKTVRDYIGSRLWNKN